MMLIVVNKLCEMEETLWLLGLGRYIKHLSVLIKGRTVVEALLPIYISHGI